RCGHPSAGLCFVRARGQTGAPREELETALAELAGAFDLTWNRDVVGRPLRTLVLVSKAAHCLADLAYRQRNDRLPVDVVGVVSNHTVLEDLARFYDYDFHHVPVTADTKAQAEARLLELVEEQDVELVVLARYMQVLSDELCRALEGKVINIHHSFLPSFKGARPYAQAHDRGVTRLAAK